MQPGKEETGNAGERPVSNSQTTRANAQKGDGLPFVVLILLIMKIEELRGVVGRVTISFAVNPETKYLLQLGAKKSKVTFSEFCRKVIEGNLPDIKEEKKETTKEKFISSVYGKSNLLQLLKKQGLQQSLSNHQFSQGEEVIKVGLKDYRITRKGNRSYTVEEL